MDNYLVVNGVRIEPTAEQVKQLISDSANKSNKVKLSDIEVGGICKIGEWEFIVCEHMDSATAILLKDCISSEKFGYSNNYANSNADAVCERFADKLASVAGKDNLYIHVVDLTADDGLRDYGVIERRVSLMTANQCRQYVDILDMHKIDKWWWTATAYSTPKHNDNTFVKSVSPSGLLSDDFDCLYDCGVRPFCILNTDIFVSK